MAQPAIKIGKNSIRKQIRKLIDDGYNEYQKIELSSSQIEMNNKKWLARNNREIYINKILFNAILDYNFAKNEVKTDYNAFNTVETKFSYFKEKLLSYIDQKIERLYQLANYASASFTKHKMGYIESKKSDIDNLSLRKILKEKLPQELSNINKNSRKYWVQTAIPVSDLVEVDDELSDQINAIINFVENAAKQIVNN